MDQSFCEVENTDPVQHQKWLDKHGFKPKADGTFLIDKFEGKDAVEKDKLYENIKTNVSGGWYEPLSTGCFDDRTFVMVCGGPSLADNLESLRVKAFQPDKYLVVCSNMTGGYLLENGIVPHAHFILDPQSKKQFDIAPGKTCKDTKYWINAASDPSVFEALKAQDIKPFMFLADFDSDGKAIQTVKDSLLPGQPGMMAIQGGTMAGLRAINLADALGFRKMEYYGFDATVKVANGKAKPYAYEKKRGEAIIEITCDQCPATFDTTLIFQKQVNEFIHWRHNMPWIDIKVTGGGLIAHYQKHLDDADVVAAAKHSTERYTEAYKVLQQSLHSKGDYGHSGHQYIPTIFHAISQLAKRLGAVTVLDYGSASGDTMRHVSDHLWLPPTVRDFCYDPFVEGFSAEPQSADLILCTDVLEHVEPECTMAVLDHITSLTKRIAFFSIGMAPANKVLDDGRNAHINLRESEFWIREITRRFIVSEAKITSDKETLLVVAQSIDDVREIIGSRK